MWSIVLNLVFKVATSQVAKTAIALAINKLLDHKDDGITKDIAETMIDGIARSKANPTTEDLFADAMLTLKQG